MDSDIKKKTAKAKGKLLVATEETQAQAAAILDKMMVSIKAHTENPALAVIKQQIGKIDELNKAGATLNQIYNQLNDGLKLGITASSFTQYVRKIRQEVGSELYVPRGERKNKDKSKADAPATETATIWNCDKCESEATRHESTKKPGAFFWKCPGCGSFYEDAAGELTSKKLRG